MKAWTVSCLSGQEISFHHSKSVKILIVRYLIPLLRNAIMKFKRNTFHPNWIFYLGKCHSRTVVIRSYSHVLDLVIYARFVKKEHFDNVLCVSANENIFFSIHRLSYVVIQTLTM